MNLEILYEKASQPIPFIPQITQHRFALRIEEFLSYWKIPSEQHKTVEEGSVLYRFVINPGLSVMYQLYKNENQEAFFRLEVGIAKIPSNLLPEVAIYLLNNNYHHFYPLWFSIADNIVIVECRSYCEGFSEDHFIIRLNTICDYALGAYADLKKQFNLQPLLPDDQPSLRKGGIAND